MNVKDFFRPKYKNSNPDIRLKAIQDLENQDILREVALDKKNYLDVRTTAIKKLCSQEVLKKIILERFELDAVRFAAIENLNQEGLENIALSKVEDYIKIIAIKQITNQRLLRKIAFMDVFTDVRCAAIESITSQQMLYNIALKLKLESINRYSNNENNDNPKLVRLALAAVKALNNQKLLGKLVLQCGQYSKSEIKYAAEEKLINKEILKNLELEEKSKIKKVQEINIQDQLLLEKIALDDDEEQIVRQIAVKKLTNQDLLEKIALEDENEHVRSSAVERLTNQDLLGKIALEDEYEHVRSSAVERLTDQDLLGKIVLEYPFKDSYEDTNLIDKIIDKLKNKEFLIKMLNTYKHWNLHKDCRAKSTKELVIFRLLEIGIEQKNWEQQVFEERKKIEEDKSGGWPSSSSSSGTKTLYLCGKCNASMDISGSGTTSEEGFVQHYEIKRKRSLLYVVCEKCGAINKTGQ